MSNVVRIKEQNTADVVDFRSKKAKIKGKEVKLKKDGTPKKIVSNSKKGDPHEVYPIKDKEQVRAIGKYFEDKKESASTQDNKRIAARNRMMWIVGINIGLRASDLRKLKWGDIFNEDGTFRDGVRKSEQKTDKYKTFFLNKYVMTAITEYIEEFNIKVDRDHLVFRSKEGGALEVRSICRIIKEATEACGININTGSHTMRKTFGYHWYMAHQGDVNALTHLQRLFNHSSPQVTLAYIGIKDEESKQFYNDLEW
jgi:integrase